MKRSGRKGEMFRTSYVNCCDDSKEDDWSADEGMDEGFNLSLLPVVSSPTYPPQVNFSQTASHSTFPFTISSLLNTPGRSPRVSTPNVNQTSPQHPRLKLSRKKDEKKYKDRWTTPETDVLVGQWVENYQLLKSSRTKEAWIDMAAAVNGVGGKGQYRTVNDCKSKIRNLIADYTKAKENNNRTGQDPHFPRYYEEFDSVLGTRDTFILPEVKERGFGQGSQTTASPSTGSVLTREEDTVSDEYLAAIDAKRKKKPDEKDIPIVKKKKKSKHDEMVALQYRQLEAFEQSDKRHNDFMKAMLEKQEKDDEREREREKEREGKEREFFLELGKLFSK